MVDIRVWKFFELMGKKVKNWVKNSNYIGDIDFDWFAIVKCDVECNKKIENGCVRKEIARGC